MSQYRRDRIENENPDPMEGSSLKIVNVPLLLLAGFLGFGVTFLTLRTDRVSMKSGDSRLSEIENIDVKVSSNSKEEGAEVKGLMSIGRKVFTTHCQACHQATGKGILGAFPPLDNSRWVTGSPERLVAIVLHGVKGEITVKGTKYNSIMPAFKDLLTDDDISSVATYIRNSFGNNASAVKPDFIQKVRVRTSSQSGAWMGEKQLNEREWE